MVNLEYDNISFAHTWYVGKYWDLVAACNSISPQTSVFKFTDWPKGNAYISDDYATICGEAPAISKSEIVAFSLVSNAGVRSEDINIKHYDSFRRKFYEYSSSANWDAVATWTGRFGEITAPMEIFSPGRYNMDFTIGSETARVYYDVYEQLNNKHVSLQGHNVYNSGDSKRAAKTGLKTAYDAITTGNTIHITSGDYSSQTSLSEINKDVTLEIKNGVYGGWVYYGDSILSYSNSNGYTWLNGTNRIEEDGTIDKYALYQPTAASTQARFKVYRGGGIIGTSDATQSTYIGGDTLKTLNSQGWHEFTLDPPLSVEKGDLIGIYVPSSKTFGADNGSNSVTVRYSTAGDYTNATFNEYYIDIQLAVKAWNSDKPTITWAI
jgi:hypothetical protein